jgi:DNA-binding response OmpR family regulator
LVVEDEPSIRKFIAINLERSGFDVLEAETGEKAVEMAEAYKPGVMVLDVMLPASTALRSAPAQGPDA